MPSPATLQNTRPTAADEHASSSESSSRASPALNSLAGSRTRMLGGPGTPSHGSRTMVISTSSREESPEGILHLRGHERRSPAGNRVQWTDDTVDNEHMGKKKSKVCCIFRKQRQFGESDSESSSGESDDDGPNEYERMPRHKPRGKHSHHHHSGECQH
ncbi:Type 1 phosphatases regulator ypi1 [Linderina pennispora]|nr:Type 1 phosphatases regulator ypi1 [Linderina pennispora]